MTRPIPTPITCPACRKGFGAILESIVDAGLDSSAKERLISGRVNVLTCPHCNYRGLVGTPLIYHDPAKKLAIIYIPTELNLSQGEREKLTRDLTSAVMRALPETAPKDYVLQSQPVLTMQELIEQVLEAEGVTQDMIQAERKKLDLIGQLAGASPEERDKLIEENWSLFDLAFLELITAAAQGATQANDQHRALQLLNIRQYLMDNTEAGQTVKAQHDALIEASKELQSYGENLTSEAFVNLLVRDANNPVKVDALATLGCDMLLLDHTTFQLLKAKIDQATSQEQRNAFLHLQNRLLEINTEYEKQTPARIQRAADTLRTLLHARDIRAAIQQNRDRIDNTFMQVLRVNFEEARRVGNFQVLKQIKKIADEVQRLTHTPAP